MFHEASSHRDGEAVESPLATRSRHDPFTRDHCPAGTRACDSITQVRQTTTDSVASASTQRIPPAHRFTPPTVHHATAKVIARALCTTESTVHQPTHRAE